MNLVDRPPSAVSKSYSKTSKTSKSSSVNPDGTPKEKKEKAPKEKKEKSEKKTPPAKPQYKSLKLLREQKPEKPKPPPRARTEEEMSRISMIAAALEQGEPLSLCLDQTPFISHPINPPYQPIISTHPINPPSNPSYQHPLSSHSLTYPTTSVMLLGDYSCLLHDGLYSLSCITTDKALNKKEQSKEMARIFSRWAETVHPTPIVDSSRRGSVTALAQLI